MAFGLRDKQRVAIFLTFCLAFVIAIMWLSAPANAFDKSSQDLTEQADFSNGTPSSPYDKWSQYDARGWKYVSKDTQNGLDSWNSYESPHGDFSANSNKCRVCHALHMAGNKSYRLLFNEDRKSECDRCHDPVTGLSGKKPYRLFSPYMLSKGKQKYDFEYSGKAPEKPRLIKGKRILVRPYDFEIIGGSTKAKAAALLPQPTPITEAKGEHTIGAGAIPDSNITLPITIQENGLVCYSCHDPHFSAQNTIKSIPRWKKRGLLKDPGENGGSAEDGLISVQAYDSNNKPILSATASPTVAEVKSAFCGDCHNKNPSWDRGVSTIYDERPNSYGHPIGNVDGKVNVYGKQQTVANSFAVDQLQQKGCLGCHAATTETDDAGNYQGPSSFPHQSKGHKLLFDDFRTASSVLEAGGFGGYTGDPNRPLPGLDFGMFTVDGFPESQPGVCRRCHTNVAMNAPEGF